MTEPEPPEGGASDEAAEDQAPPGTTETETEPEAATHPLDKIVFGVSAVVVLAVIAVGALFPDGFEQVSTASLDWVISHFGWLFVIAANVFLVLAIYLAASRFGNIRLGRADEEPEFRTLPWIAMMFAAGMGIGLMFYGVAEPLMHYLEAPPPLELDPDSPFYEDDLLRGSLVYSYFHWGLHPWAIYAVAGLALAYSTFRKGRGNSFSEAFAPLIGGRRWGRAAGRTIDVFAIFATVFGTAASLGLGALQVAVGLDIVAGVPGSTQLYLIVIAALTAAFVASAFSGVHRGVKWLSTVNALLVVPLLVFVFLVGPTLFILDAWPSSVGSYLSSLVQLSSVTGAFGGEDWMATWTIFYWAWWLSWAPFVGTFIARISRGRSIRQFVVGVLLVPSAASTVWFAIMGGTAIWRQSNTGSDYADSVAGGGEEYALFALLDSLPLYSLMGGLSMVLVAIYFVTGADAASIVVGSLSSSGSLAPKKPLVVFWGATIGAVAAVLLLSGGLEGLKNATIIVGLPFVVVMLLLCASLMRELNYDPGANPLRQQLRHKGFREAIRRMVGEEVGAQNEHPSRWPRGRLRFGLGARRRSNQDE